MGKDKKEFNKFAKYLERKKEKIGDLGIKSLGIYPMIDSDFCIELVRLLDGEIKVNLRYKDSYKKNKIKGNK